MIDTKVSDEFITFSGKAADRISAVFTFEETVINMNSMETPVWAAIVLTKRIKASDINWNNGNPIFIFRAEGVKEDGNPIVFYQMIEFTSEYVSQNTDSDGYVKLCCT